MKKKVYFIFAFSALVFLLALAGLFFKTRTLQTNSFYTSVNVTDSLGLDVNSTALTFGGILKGGSSSRNLVFENTYPFPVVLITKSEGSISSLLTFDDKVIVKEGETKKIPFSAIAQSNASEGFYDGYVFLTVKPA